MPAQKYAILSDETLTEFLRRDDMGAFEEIYHRYWPRLHSLAYKRIRSRAITEEIIQDIFTKLWLNRAKLLIHHSLSAYLLTAARYRVLDYMKQEMVRKNYRSSLQHLGAGVDNSTEETVLHHDLQVSLEAGIHQLPPKCRSVFELSRRQQLSIREIAARLEISEKTVENHLNKALRLLRANLRDYLTFAIIAFSFLQ